MAGFTPKMSFALLGFSLVTSSTSVGCTVKFGLLLLLGARMESSCWRIWNLQACPVSDGNVVVISASGP